MTAITATLALLAWSTPTDAPALFGDAAFYVPDLLPQVCATRGLSLTGYDGAAATMSCGDLGRDVWVFGDKLLVCDCSQRDHYQMNIDRGRVVDLDWATWQRHRLPLRPVPVAVLFEPPWHGRRWE